MQLSTILLYTVAILAILSGLSVFIGAYKGEKFRAALFLIATLIAGAWVISLILWPMPNNIARFIWLGPLAITIAIIIFYYAILRYRIIRLSARWLKVLSYVVLITVTIAIYMIISYSIFTYLFKIPDLSNTILALNFIMVVVLLILMPIFNELADFINSLINTGQVNLPYIIKHLNRMATHVKLKELAEFLKKHMHFSYIGFLIDSKLYGSDKLALSTGEMRLVSKLKTPEKGLWQTPSPEVAPVFERLNISAVAALNNAKGKPFGQIIVGKPQGKTNLGRKDLLELETIINLVAALIDTGA